MDQMYKQTLRDDLIEGILFRFRIVKINKMFACQKPFSINFQIDLFFIWTQKENTPVLLCFLF